MSTKPDADAHEQGGRWYRLARLSQDFIAAGWLARLIPSEAHVWWVLWKHADVNTWECWPSLGTIAEAAGLAPGTVAACTHELERHKLIVRKRGGGLESTRYTLQPIDAPRKGKDTLSPGDESPLRPGAKAPVSSGRKELSSGGDTNCNQVTGASERQPTTPASAAVVGHARIQEGGEGLDAAVDAELKAAGIDNHKGKRAELARLWSGLPCPGATIRAIVAKGKGRGKDTGAIILELKARAEAIATAEAIRRKGAEETRRRERAEQAYHAEMRAAYDYVAGLSGEQKARLVAKAIQTAEASGDTAMARGLRADPECRREPNKLVVYRCAKAPAACGPGGKAPAGAT